VSTIGAARLWWLLIDGHFSKISLFRSTCTLPCSVLFSLSMRKMRKIKLILVDKRIPEPYYSSLGDSLADLGLNWWVQKAYNELLVFTRGSSRKCIL
jgi:hypothetical protein